MIRTVSMVALVGQPSGWPVSNNAGILTPASVTAPYERENSGGDSFRLLLEFIAMMTIPVQNHPNFRFASWLSVPPAAPLFTSSPRQSVQRVKCRLLAS